MSCFTVLSESLDRCPNQGCKNNATEKAHESTRTATLYSSRRHQAWAVCMMSSEVL